MGRQQNAAEQVWISYAEAQQLVGIGRTSLFLACRAGEIRTARVGRRVLLHKASVLKFVERAAGPDEER